MATTTTTDAITTIITTITATTINNRNNNKKKKRKQVCGLSLNVLWGPTRLGPILSSLYLLPRGHNSHHFSTLPLDLLC